MKKDSAYIKGRGAQLNPANRFLKNEQEIYVDDLATEEERLDALRYNAKTKFIEVFPKTILNKVESPDLLFPWSMNPYQGCEHGCVYCYARNTHEYWGYSAGKDFEQNIMVKKTAPELLRKTLLSKKWEASAITLSGNTDCYQPAERKFGITRKCLEVFLDLKHPVSIITKNVMIERDLDIIQRLAEQNLIWVTLSLTTLDEDLKRIMEPRTSSARNILRTVKSFSDLNIPVHVNMAPIIPSLNDESIFEVMEAVVEAGALSCSYIVARLNGHNGKIFEDWLIKNFPDRVQKITHQIQHMHGGQVNDTQYGRRMKGEGKFAEMIKQQFALARNKYMPDKKMPNLDFSLFEKRKQEILAQQNRPPQMELF